MRMFDEYRFLSSYLGGTSSRTKCDETVNLLFKKYHTLEQILQRGDDEISELAGEQTASALALLETITSRRFTDKIKIGEVYCDEDIREYLRWLYFGRSAECVFIHFFDTKQRFIRSAKISEGTVNTSELVPRRALEAVAKCKVKPRYAILSHNHPSGNTDPSESDRYATEIIWTTLEGVGVELLCHYVVAGKRVDPIDAED